jgi:DNA-directed RNA polymerase specialized sigma24 family protein
MPLNTATVPVRRPVAGSPWLAPCGASTKLVAVSQDAPDDGELMLRYGAGDAAAFEALYSRHRAPLWRFVLGNLHDETAAADVFQDIWARVIAHRARYAATARFTTWLYRIAHNCCVDHWRRLGRTTRREHPGGEEALSGLADCAGKTPEEPDAQRSAFLLYVEGGLSLADIAAATGVGVETAKSRLRYAATRLRSALAGD